MATISVDCEFAGNGSVRVRRVKVGEMWQAVSQGRQWLDQNGRHILIMLEGNDVREIVLRSDTMTWEIKPERDHRHVV